MKEVLDGRFAPITDSIAFYETPLEAVGAIFLRRRQRFSFPWSVKMRTVREPFPDVLHRLEPLTMTGASRHLLLATRSSWVAAFSNDIHAGVGQDVGFHCLELKCRGLAITCVAHTLTGKGHQAKGRSGSIQFSLYGPEGEQRTNLQTGKPYVWPDLVRYIAAHFESRWEFHVDGEIQPFEQPEAYEATRVRDRFTSEMLEAYCAALGVRCFDPDFYGPEGLLIGPRMILDKGMTLAEARRRSNISS